MSDTTKIVIAYLEKNTVSLDELPGLIRKVRSALKGEEPAKPIPEQTVFDDYLICLEDGEHVQLLKRYLAKHFQMTPEQYREKWGLPENYPMVAKSYSLKRSQIAKDQGLGRRAV